MTITSELVKFVESDAYRQLFDGLREKYLREFETSKQDGYDAREWAYTMLKATRDLQVEIERYVNDLKVRTKLQRN